MKQKLIPLEFSVITITSRDWQTGTIRLTNEKPSAFLTIAVPPESRVYCFRDSITGASLFINANNTFRLIDRDGYNSGTVWTRQMVFEKNNVSIWHQDQRFSFTCNANLKTGFCFGWLIDRTYGKSCRVLDPGRTG